MRGGRGDVKTANGILSWPVGCPAQHNIAKSSESVHAFRSKLFVNEVPTLLLNWIRVNVLKNYIFTTNI
jgi:hypothetical protein